MQLGRRDAPHSSRSAHLHVAATPCPCPGSLQDDSDGASSIDSGIAESVSGMSICSRPSAAPRMPGGPYALGRPSATPHRTGLGSVLGGGHGASATAGAYLPAAATGSAIARLVPYGSDADVAHNLLELTVHSAQVGGRCATDASGLPAGVGAPGASLQAAASASWLTPHAPCDLAANLLQIRYRKQLSTPIFSISVRGCCGGVLSPPLLLVVPGHLARKQGVPLAVVIACLPPL